MLAQDVPGEAVGVDPPATGAPARVQPGAERLAVASVQALAAIAKVLTGSRPQWSPACGFQR